MQSLQQQTNRDGIKKLHTALKKPTETAYLLSTKANQAHLAKSIDQLKKGESKTIRTTELWK